MICVLMEEFLEKRKLGQDAEKPRDDRVKCDKYIKEKVKIHE